MIRVLAAIAATLRYADAADFHADAFAITLVY